MEYLNQVLKLHAHVLPLPQTQTKSPSHPLPGNLLLTPIVEISDNH